MYPSTTTEKIAATESLFFGATSAGSSTANMGATARDVKNVAVRIGAYQLAEQSKTGAAIPSVITDVRFAAGQSHSRPTNETQRNRNATAIPTKADGITSSHLVRVDIAL